MKPRILGESKVIKDLLKMIEKVAKTKTNILVTGDSGTGKELVAKMIHYLSPFKANPFIPVNCGAIPETLIESEMFGHKKGSFTGAVNDKIGLFEAANKGTLFLDEVGELPLDMQVKLLRAIQEKTIRPIGSNEAKAVDVRIISATNRDLEAMTADGSFREDLFYRLNVILIRTPALRERQGDIELLANEFLNKLSTKMNKNVGSFSKEAMEALCNYSWPGNVRELENVIERALTLENDEQIHLHALPDAICSTAKVESQIKEASLDAKQSDHGDELRLPAPDFTNGAIDLESILGEVEKTYLMSALNHTGGVKKAAAESLKITFRSIRYRLKKHKIDS